MINNESSRNIPLLLKLSALISLLFIVGIATVSVVVLTKQNDSYSEQTSDLANALVMQLAASSTEPLFTEDLLSLQMMVNSFAKLPRFSGVIVVDSQKKPLASAGNIAQLKNKTLKILARQPTINSERSKNGRISVVAPIIFQGVTGGYVAIELQTDVADSAYLDSLIVTLGVVGLVIVIAIIAAYYISRSVTRPITRLLDATMLIGKGNYSIQAKDRRNDELGRLMSAINEMGQGLLQKKQVESLLGNFLAKDVAEAMLLQLDTVKISGERVNATVLFVDIVGFTSLSEKLSPEEVGDFLNEYFSYFSMCSRMYFGTIDKFIGDCAMVVFGAPKKDENHHFNALACAVLMQKLNKNINQVRKQQGQLEIHLRIGVNSGSMLAGVLGNQQKMEYTVVGDSVNLASRLCSEVAPEQIITTSEVYNSALLGNKIIARPYQQLNIRGKEQKVETYIVEGVRSDYQMVMDSLIDDVVSNLISNKR